MADNLDPEIQRQLNEQMENLRDTVNGMVPSLVLMTAAMKEQIAASKGLSGAEKDGKSVVDNWLKAQSDQTQTTKASTEATKKYNEAMDNLNKALYSGAASLAGFGKALYARVTLDVPFIVAITSRCPVVFVENSSIAPTL